MATETEEVPVYVINKEMMDAISIPYVGTRFEKIRNYSVAEVGLWRDQYFYCLFGNSMFTSVMKVVFFNINTAIAEKTILLGLLFCICRNAYKIITLNTMQ